MLSNTIDQLPNRITDLVALKEKGIEVSCNPSFEILPVDFAHRDNQFQAFIFLCRFNGSIDGHEYMFRKCYARGCPHNLCPHVSQAVMIANRYLQRDYKKLEDVGVQVEKKLFTLEDMVIKFDSIKEEQGPLLTIHDYINIAKEGNEVAVELELEFVTGVEHFANYQNQQVFLMVDFAVTMLDKTHHYERCLACYEAEKEQQDRSQAINIANERLKLLWEEFDRASVKYEKRFFE
ncbi:MAG: hypothetical protein WCB15_20250 [Desulfobacterales bacterium]|jgi:hypothetical protein